MKRWFTFLLLYSSILQAQNWEVNIPVATQHFFTQKFIITVPNDICTGGFCYEYEHINNINPGVIIYKLSNKFKYGVGVYRNSFRNTAFALGVGYNFNNTYSVEGGLVSGYRPYKDSNRSSILPIYSLSYSFYIFKLSINHELVNLGLRLIL